MGKDIFYFSRADRIATGILLAVIVGTAVLRIHFSGHGQDVALPPDTVGAAVTQSRYVRTDTVVRRVYVTQKVQRAPSSERKSVNAQTTRRDSVIPDTTRTLFPRYPVKHRPESPVDLNVADSAQLILLPGIGSYYASRIISYRTQLGGYHSVEQLAEIEGMPDSVRQWFTVADSVPIQRMPVNELSLSLLRRHPYMNFYQARAIVELRRDRGKVKGPQQLLLLEEFTEEDLLRLEPYLDFR